MSSFTKFLSKYAGEALGIASALNTLLEGLALSPKQSAGVKAVIDKLETAAESITGSLDNVAKETVVKISKADIAEAVKAYFNSVDGKKLIKEATNVEKA